ncbi:DarT ssDNA thymidine ADP-ribosyltransferase family protein [Ruegeria denitrificans]|uniref:DarT ssDNA thymidine ADP-ribosyltransferase family protein n=1 Tax=Ruegeria denitrificans TaxID=1715692 RepID=UPI00071E309A|nr:DarT ssDNA thymidine ADP-ribosyltransferase family protein [Ruegeria denitrificans]
MKETKRQVRIKEVAEAHGVRRVLHFTAIENIPSIVQHGLLSVQECRRRGLEVVTTDCFRIDNRTDTICTTITNVNCEMLNRKIVDFPNRRWVILHLSPEILWECRCRFLHTNASRREILPYDHFYESAEAFEAMFRRNRAGITIVGSQAIPANVPLDPQAEVQVSDHIPARFILGAEVRGREDAIRVDTAFRDLPEWEREVSDDSHLLWGR